MPQPFPRTARVLATLGPVALLAACGGSSEPAASETASAAPAMAPATPVAAATPIAYDCLPGKRLSATYDTAASPAKATLTLDGKTYELTGVEAASGAKYVTDNGLSAGKTLVWWTKGDDGTLYEGKVGGSVADEKQLATCSPSRA